MNELKKASETNLSSFKKSLKSIKVNTRDEAIDILNFVSAIKSAEKEIKAECYKKLDSCAECEFYESSNGNQVKRLERTVLVAEEDEYLKQLKNRLKLLKEEIKDYEKALPKKEIKSHYYKSI